MRRARGVSSIDVRDAGGPPPAVRSIRVVNLPLTQTGTSPAINLIGTVYVPISVAVRMTLGGVLGVALLQISVNGGPFGLPQLAAGSLALPGQPPGANLVLSAGVYVLGDSFSISVAA